MHQFAVKLIYCCFEYNHFFYIKVHLRIRF
nr:MAG TPA: hypothetical protein [Caudoviricetes sp.]